MVKDVEELSAELRAEPFLEFPVFEYRKIQVAEGCVAENILAHRAKLPIGRRNQYGTATSITAIIGERGHCQCTVLGSLREALGIARARGKWDAVRSSRKIFGLAVEVPGLTPAVGIKYLAGAAEVVVSVLQCPGCGRLHGRNRSNLPALQDLERRLGTVLVDAPLLCAGSYHGEIRKSRKFPGASRSRR